LLPRSHLTDCSNAGEGTLVGDAGLELGGVRSYLELGGVRYYPKQLSSTEIKELFSAGATLQDISIGSEPLQEQDSDVEQLRRSLSVGVSDLQHRVAAQHQDSQLNVILQNAREDSPAATKRSPAAPLGAISASTTLDTDSGNRAYYSLVVGPYLLSSTEGMTENKHRTITNVPSFVGTGATVSYWCRHKTCSSGRDCGAYLLVSRSLFLFCLCLGSHLTLVHYLRSRRACNAHTAGRSGMKIQPSISTTRGAPVSSSGIHETSWVSSFI
jgi:hypothetical protein